MRIVQIIDSLEIGGAEKMALNYANALSNQIAFSGLVATRKEGNLKPFLNEKVTYLFLNRKYKLDVEALLEFRKFVNKNKVQIVHAHSSSIFFALLLKFSLPKIKIIWHDHYGISQNLNKRPYFLLRLLAPFFKGIISVNQSLYEWSKEKLNHKNVVYIPNFSIPNKMETLGSFKLKGIDGYKIVCLANLRPQKNHLLLLQTAVIICHKYKSCTFHLVGKNFEDDYAKKIKNFILENHLVEKVFVYGSQNEVDALLKQASIGVLTSNSEGLPLAILEYGYAGLPVVATDVGDVKKIITNNHSGILVPQNNLEATQKAIERLLDSEALRIEMGKNLKLQVDESFSAKKNIEKYLKWINQ
jgi:glycosyltransferase involved in cell wall biosynthesis